MLCKNCNSPITEDTIFCPVCGAKIEQEETNTQDSFVFYEDVNSQKKEITIEDLPEHLKPLSAWSYFWLQVLYSIPIIGFIFLIIFSFKKSNINRRSFTRSYWCALLVYGIIVTVFVILAFVFAGRMVYGF